MLVQTETRRSPKQRPMPTVLFHRVENVAAPHSQHFVAVTAAPPEGGYMAFTASTWLCRSRPRNHKPSSCLLLLPLLAALCRGHRLPPRGGYMAFTASTWLCRSRPRNRSVLLSENDAAPPRSIPSRSPPAPKGQSTPRPLTLGRQYPEHCCQRPADWYPGLPSPSTFFSIRQTLPDGSQVV
jgi:hypothetical protein